MFSQFEIWWIIPMLVSKKNGSDIFKSAWNSKYMWEMHRSWDVHKALMRAKWVMNFAHHFLASLQLGTSIRWVLWPQGCSGNSVAQLCVSSSLCWALTQGMHHKHLLFLGYFIKENKLHWIGPKPENLRLCSQRNINYRDRIFSFPFFEINTLLK